MDGCGLALMYQSTPLHATNRPRLCSVQYIMYFAVGCYWLTPFRESAALHLAPTSRPCAVHTRSNSAGSTTRMRSLTGFLIALSAAASRSVCVGPKICTG